MVLARLSEKSKDTSFPKKIWCKQGMEKRDEIHRGEQQGADNIFAGLYRGLRAGEFAVRIIDAFVDGLDISEFRHSMLNDIGRPPYNPRDLLKLYIYGYFNRIRLRPQADGRVWEKHRAFLSVKPFKARFFGR